MLLIIDSSLPSLPFTLRRETLRNSSEELEGLNSYPSHSFSCPITIIIICNELDWIDGWHLRIRLNPFTIMTQSDWDGGFNKDLIGINKQPSSAPVPFVQWCCRFLISSLPTHLLAICREFVCPMVLVDSGTDRNWIIELSKQRIRNSFVLTFINLLIPMRIVSSFNCAESYSSSKWRLNR